MLNTQANTITQIFPWFKNWFDSVYYHKLYSNRDEKEAAKFIDELATLLPHRASVIDVGCGTGRHSKSLAEKGFQVTGIDLSSYSLQQAKQYKRENLQFFRHDMRKPFGRERFDVALNLFTSFGYFETREENMHVIENMHNALKPGGTLVIDYLNRYHTENHLVAKEEKEIDGIIYTIDRWTDEQFFYKHVQVEDAALAEFSGHTEKVAKFGLQDFEEMLTEYGFEITDVCGDYKLNDFDEEVSKRLIIVARKN
jgi:SAM-dependent methyltransferase